MTQPAPDNWVQANALEPDPPPPPPVQSWPPPPPQQPPRAEPPQLRLVSPNEASPDPAPVAPTAPPVRSLGLTRPSVTSDLDSELQAAREELHALHELLEELPAIFERKFQQRLKAALQDQRRLLGENQELRSNLAALMPGATMPVANPSPRLLLPPALERASSLGQTLRQVLRRGREDRAGEPDDATGAAAADPLASRPLAAPKAQTTSEP